jgi:hypothetical protein
MEQYKFAYHSTGQRATAAISRIYITYYVISSTLIAFFASVLLVVSLLSPDQYLLYYTCPLQLSIYIVILALDLVPILAFVVSVVVKVFHKWCGREILSDFCWHQ